MYFLSYHPKPPLGEFIDSLWLLEDAPSHARERILPSGTLEMVINLREDEFRIYPPSGSGSCCRYSGAMVSGAYGEGFVIDAAQHACVLGVHFKPGGAFPFLGLPAGEIADAHVDLDVLWGQPAVELRERLCAARSAPERFRLLEEALTVHLLPRAHHAAVPAALDAFEGTDSKVRDVARLVGLSQRRFIQVFTAEVGMTPKRFCRVRRFQRARELALRSPAPDWARLAAACGYCDQSHLIHDFLAFSGFSPAGYLRRWSERVKEDHVPLAG